MAPLTGKVPGNSSGTLSYAIPAAGLAVESVYVAIDATGAAGAVTAELTITDQSGAVIAKRQQTNTVPAGSTGSATWALRLGDDSEGASPGTTPYDREIIALSPDGFWKLNETIGAVAFDSSGNGHHLGVASAVAPTWAQLASPAGTLAPFFAVNQLIGSAAPLYQPNTAGDFTIAGWINTTGPQVNNDDGVAQQSDPFTTNVGWLLGYEGANIAGQRRAVALIGQGAGRGGVEADSQQPFNAWYHFGMIHTAGTFVLYVSGVAQTATYSGAYTSALTELHLGRSTGTGCYVNYVTYFGHAITAGQMLTLATVP